MADALTELRQTFANMNQDLNGVQLGPTVWYVKIESALEQADAALGRKP